MYVCLWYVCLCECIYIDTRGWGGTRERERKWRVRNCEREKTRSAKARNSKAQKSAQKLSVGSAKTQKKRVPSSASYMFRLFLKGNISQDFKRVAKLKQSKGLGVTWIFFLVSVFPWISSTCGTPSFQEKSMSTIFLYFSEYFWEKKIRISSVWDSANSNWHSI
jgi:hypothetical protein